MSIDKDVHETLSNKAVFNRLFNSPDGKKALKILSSFCFSGVADFHESSNYMYYLAGRRDLFMQLLKLAKVDEDVYLKEYLANRMKVIGDIDGRDRQSGGDSSSKW